ncbi:MAG: glycosyltransferase family 4 protein [Mariprofundaceae bacterium]|nr:glycosyltransferase family 4 protein [Mariprofundaceae bacterium]
MGIVVNESLDATTGVAILRQRDKRVLVVADVSAEDVIGGAERMLHHHIRALLKDGLDVTLVTRQPKPDAPLRLCLPSGVVEYRLPFSGQRGWQGLQELKASAKAWWQTHQGFDVIVAEQPFTMWALMQAGCTLPRLQVCHSFAFEEYATRHGLGGSWKQQLVIAAMRRLETSVYQSATSSLVLSQFMCERLQDFFSIKQNAIRIAAGGINPIKSDNKEQDKSLLRQTLWGETANQPHIITLRNLVPRTGVDLLIQAAAIVHVDRPDVMWDVMGDGKFKTALQGLSVELSMQDVIHFTGFLSENKVNEYMMAADAFMLPTRSLEGFGLVTLEANVHGLPVIATPVGANPDVVGWHTLNHVAEQATPDALAQAVLTYLANTPDEAQRKNLSKETANYFSWGKHDSVLVNAIRLML